MGNLLGSGGQLLALPVSTEKIKSAHVTKTFMFLKCGKVSTMSAV